MIESQLFPEVLCVLDEVGFPAPWRAFENSRETKKMLENQFHNSRGAQK